MSYFLRRQRISSKSAVTDQTKTVPASELFSLRLPNHLDAPRVARAAVAAQLRSIGYQTAVLQRVEIVVEEACSNVVKHAYRADEEATFSVACSLDRAQLRIRVHDRGAPCDFAHLPPFDPAQGQDKGLGVFLMQRLLPELRFVNLGRDGKAVDLLFPLPGGWSEHPPPAHLADAEREEPSPDPRQLRVRLFQPADAAQIARCAYRVYGYSYFGEHVYIPERLIAMNAAGDLTSVVVVDDRDRVYGHLALVFSPLREIPEEGQAFVMPEARGGGCLTRMKTLLNGVAHDRRLPGVFSDAVTVHPYTQRANLGMNSRECGLLLAFAPGSVQFNDLHAADDLRHSLVVFYKPLADYQTSRAFLPPRHAEMIAAIHDNVGVRLEPLTGETPLAEKTELDVACVASRGIAYIVVKAYGPDLIERLRQQTRALCLHGMAVIQLDLPMRHSAVASQLEAIEALGYFFVGVVPHYFVDAPSLRLQFLNNVELRPDSVVLVSDFAKRLFAYIQRGMPE